MGFCVRNASLDFSDAVEALYKRLRQEEQDVTRTAFCKLNKAEEG
jgi:hypothetical protein